MAKPMKLGGLHGLQDLSEMLEVGSMQARQKPMELALDDVLEDPEQPRIEFDVVALAELADSIKERGVRTPVSVRPHPAMQGKWLLNHGARRYRASRIAGKTTIPAFVDESHDNYDQVVENLQRDSLTPREIALFIQKRLKMGDKKGEIASRLGKGREPAFISYHMALIDAPAVIDDAYAAGTTSPKTLYDLRTLHEKEPEQAAALVASGEKITRKKISDITENLVMTKKPEPADKPKNLVMTKKDDMAATSEQSENLVMTKKSVSAKPESGFIIVEHNGREAVITNSRFTIRYTDDRAVVEVASTDIEVVRSVK